MDLRSSTAVSLQSPFLVGDISSRMAYGSGAPGVSAGRVARRGLHVNVIERGVCGGGHWVGGKRVVCGMARGLMKAG